MRSEKLEVFFMSSISSLTRGLAAAVVVLAGAAMAQPANDACAGALSLGTVPGDGSAVSSAVVSGLQLAAAGVEQPMGCGGTAQTQSVWFSFTAPRTGSYRVSSCASTNLDSVLQLYSGTCGALTQVAAACDDDGCGGAGGPSSVAVWLSAGQTYFAQLAAFDATVVVTQASRMGLSVSFTAADSCAGGTPLSLTLNSPHPFSTSAATLNDSQVGGLLDGGAGTCFLGMGHSTNATNNASIGRDVVFGFTPGSTGPYNVRLTGPSVALNSVLYLTDSCTAAMTPPQIYAPPQCLAAANRGSSATTGNEELFCVPMTASVPYFVWADETALSTAGANYELEVTACTLEIEPNDAVATAGALACPVSGRLTPAGEADFFSLGSNPTGSRVFALIDAPTSGSAGGSSNDFDLRITSATDTLEYDDANADTPFGGLSAAIAGTPLPNGPAFARVSHFSGTALEPYRLYTTVQTGTATAEVEPNETIAAASGGTSNYFSGDVTSTTDVDFFAFEARAGDQLFLALDSAPARTGSTASSNHTLQLFNAAGVLLVGVNDSGTTVNNTVVTGSLTSTTPALPAEALVYRVRANGTYYARVGRTGATGGSQYLLSISKDCSVGGGIGAPSLSSLTPTSGSVVGNETITLTGSGFSSASVVRIGGALATVASRTSTTLEVLTPAGSEGVVDVAVINPGAQTSTLTGGFTYIAPIAPPTIASVTPATGPTAGGTVITVNGTLFKAGALVTLTVGGAPVAATNVVVVTSAQLRATTPAHAAGLASITVRNPVDALEGSRADVFTYLAPPTISSITPNVGLTSGGQTITLQGTAFRPGAVVRFGANAGTAVAVDVSGTSLTVNTPSALVTGAVDVTLVNADTQQAVVTGGFTYQFPAPTISTVTPSLGYAVGGTPITIVGTGFQAAPTVTVGGAPATNVARTSLTQITAVTPAGAAGLADVTVTNSDTQSVTRTGGFRYVPAPTLSAISPSNGAVQGGTLITLTGQNFQAGASVRLGGVPAFAVNVTSPTTATAVSNSNRPGPADVVLTNPDNQVATLTAGFTFDPAPSMVSLSPISGSTAGGTVVTISGAGFLSGATVSFGGAASTLVTVSSPTSLTAVTPAASVGVVSVTVRNADNQSATLAGGFRFVAPPTLTTAAPDTGDVGGGTLVRLTGTGFNAGTTVSFGGTAATQVSLVSSTELDAVTPRHLPGAVDVVVSTDGAIATLANGFTFTRGAPTLEAVAPVSGPIAGGTLLTLSGTGFAPGASITVGGGAATDVVIVSSVLARAVVPAHAAGAVDVVFTNDDAQAVTLARGFTYVAPPSNDTGTVTDGGDGAIGAAPTGGGGGAGGVSCGCSSFDGSMLSMAGFGLLVVLSRRRRSTR